MNDFISLTEVGREGLQRLLDLAAHFKAKRGAAQHLELLKGKSVALVFEKASTRTRLSLEVAVTELGGTPIVISREGSQLGRGEPIEDTARVLSRMVHAITFRTFGHEALLKLAEFSAVPVLNALTDAGHPMQLLADLLTIRDEFGTLDGLVYAWVGDGNNMANSWLEAATLLGLELRLACPKGYEPSPERVHRAIAAGARVTVGNDARAACRDADVINTDVFASMGQEAEQEERLKAFAGFCIDTQLVRCAKSRAIVLHCLPAHRGEEISNEVLEGEQSRVWSQAEARLHTSKAALCWALDVSVPR